jgi:hypothetical protein
LTRGDEPKNPSGTPQAGGNGQSHAGDELFYALVY